VNAVSRRLDRNKSEDYSVTKTYRNNEEDQLELPAVGWVQRADLAR
jgi:hypothetical protein